jgi:hypothetical protein
MIKLTIHLLTYMLNQGYVAHNLAWPGLWTVSCIFVYAYFQKESKGESMTPDCVFLTLVTKKGSYHFEGSDMYFCFLFSSPSQFTAPEQYSIIYQCQYCTVLYCTVLL